MKVKGKSKPQHKNVDASAQRVAIAEALGYPVKEIRKVVGKTDATAYNRRMEAYDKGYVQELQGKMKESAVNIIREREFIASRCFGRVGNTLERIEKKIEREDIEAEKKGKENPKVYMKEAEFALKAVGETEHSGRKVDAPKLVVNMKENATLNIQQNFRDINDILERSGLDLEELVGVT